MVRNISEATLLHSLKQHPGWKVLSEELKRIFDSEYTKLRKCKRDADFYKIQGRLDIIDRIFDLVEQKILESEEE